MYGDDDNPMSETMVVDVDGIELHYLFLANTVCMCITTVMFLLLVLLES